MAKSLKTKRKKLPKTDNAALRKQKVAEYGVGFELPASIVVVKL